MAKLKTMEFDFEPRPPRRPNARRATTKQRRYQHVLDVSVRTSQAGRQRKRRILRVATISILAVSIAGGLYFGVSRAVAWLIWKNPDYNVAQLDVQTDGILEPAQVLATADLHTGGNIYLVDLSGARERLEKLPEVAQVEVDRQPPDRITVQITERKPVAWMAPPKGAETREAVIVSAQSFLIDGDGVVLRPRKVTAQDRYLPVIRNYTGPALTEGMHAEGEEVKAALELLRAHRDSMVATRFQVEEIDLGKHYGLIVTDQSGTKVTFPLAEMDRQLKRLDTYLQFTEQHGEKIQAINLLATKNVPVTLMVSAVTVDKAPDSLQTTAAVSTPIATPSPTPAKLVPPTKSSAATFASRIKAQEKKSSPSPAPAPPRAMPVQANPTPSATPRKDHSAQPFLFPSSHTATPTGVN